MYDYLIVGAGLYGAVFAREATDVGKRCLVIDRRPHIGGNVYTEYLEGIHVHKYGPHIFHTNDKSVWDYVNRFSKFTDYIYSPVANYRGRLYNLPFNMNTFSQLWGVTEPEDAKAIIDSQRLQVADPKNLEEQALSMVGKDIYETLIKEYTEKQWQRPCSELPVFIIKRLPVRFTYDNNYFSDEYQGIPSGGYTEFIENLLYGVEVRLNTPFVRTECRAKKIVYTGAIDEFFGYALGSLEYRSLRFEEEVVDKANIQNSVVVYNYTSSDVPCTRTIEHKHFSRCTNVPKSVITTEYPMDWKPGGEPYYPINDEKNDSRYAQYLELAKDEPDVIFGGRLGEYKYYDMDKVIAAALKKSREELVAVQAPEGKPPSAGKKTPAATPFKKG